MNEKIYNVYLNSASTTKPTKEVIEDINFYLTHNWSNPSDISQMSVHSNGDISIARSKIAKAIGSLSQEIFFTSGGSEANNWAIKGIIDRYSECKTIITTQIEHPSVYNTCKYLETKGYAVKYLSVDCFGQIKLSELEKLLKDIYETNENNIPLVSIMFANNEVGTIQPIKKISDIVHKYNGIFHCDAVQAFIHTHINVKELGIDLMSVSGHKINCPKGIGFLYKRKGLEIAPLIHGGKQEFGLRGGTENVPYICAMGNQVERLSEDLDIYLERTVDLHNYIIQNIYESCGYLCNVYLNGHPKERVANNLSFTFEGINAEQLISMLDTRGMQVSAGSACSVGSKVPSRVLKAMGFNDEEAFSTIRVSFDYDTTKDMVDAFVDTLVKCLQSLQMFTN